jgi:hypothetical protein
MTKETIFYLSHENAITTEKKSSIIAANQIFIQYIKSFDDLPMKVSFKKKSTDYTLNLFKSCNANSLRIYLGYNVNYNDVERLYSHLAMSKVTSIDLSNNLNSCFDIIIWRNNYRKISFFIKLLYMLPNFTTLKLSNNNLIYMDVNERENFFLWLRNSNIRSLDLSKNGLNSMSTTEWQNFFLELKRSNVSSLNLSDNALYLISSKCWEIFCSALGESNIESIDLSGNKLDLFSGDQWASFRLALVKSNIYSMDLSGNNLEKISEDNWVYLIHILKYRNINKIILGKDTITELSDKKKQDLANLHLTKIPLSKYSNMSILQFEAVFTSLGYKFKDKNREDSFYKYSMLVTHLLKYLFIQGLNDRLNSNLLDINDFLDILPAEQEIFLLNTPLSKLNSAHCLHFIHCLYEKNYKLQTIRVANSECFLFPVEEFLKAIDVNASDIILKHLDNISQNMIDELYSRDIIISYIVANILGNDDIVALDMISKEQSHITTAQLKSIIIIAEKYNKHEIVSEVENIMKLRDDINKNLVSVVSEAKPGVASEENGNNRVGGSVRMLTEQRLAGASSFVRGV